MLGKTLTRWVLLANNALQLSCDGIIGRDTLKALNAVVEYSPGVIRIGDKSQYLEPTLTQNSSPSPEQHPAYPIEEPPLQLSSSELSLANSELSCVESSSSLCKDDVIKSCLVSKCDEVCSESKNSNGAIESLSFERNAKGSTARKANEYCSVSSRVQLARKANENGSISSRVQLSSRNETKSNVARRANEKLSVSCIVSTKSKSVSDEGQLGSSPIRETKSTSQGQC